MKVAGSEALAALKIRQTKSAQLSLNYSTTAASQATPGFRRQELEPHICTVVWNLSVSFGVAQT